MGQGRTCLSAVVVASLLVSGTPLRSAEPIAEVPFELYQRHLIVTRGSIGQLNGRSLLIDTGTIPSMVDARIARKLKLKSESSTLVAFGRRVQIQSAVLDGLRIGPLQSGPVSAGISDLSYLEGVRIDAIVGLDVLARKSFSIDYRTRVLRFAPAGREDSVAPLEVVWPFLTVRMTIAGQQVRLLVDTGSSDLVLFKTRMPTALSSAPWRGDKTVQYASGAVVSNFHFHCNTGYSERDCEAQLSRLRRVLGGMDLTPLGEWTWILVRSEHWKPILRRVGRDPDSPAFTILEKRQTFLEEALFSHRPDRGGKLLEKWRMPLDELLPFAVAHELGHAVCHEADERRTNGYAAQLRATGTIRCGAR